MAKMHTNPMNAAFLMMESRERPMHVATLLIYSLPPGAGADFVKRFVADLQQSTEFVAPFNLRLKNPVLKFALPMWQEDFDLDLEYHVRHSALPYPGGERELGVLISRLHSNPMDLNRPLWEYHVIEGLERNRFAVYFKMHHALVDGLAGLRMLQRSMSTRQEDVNTPALWSAHPPGGGLARPFAPFNWDLLGLLGGALRSAGDVANALLAMLQAAYDQMDPVKLPFETPVSILNHRVHSQRRFATQTCEFERIRRLSKHADCTINDVVLALCSGALRRFLKDLGVLPGRSLTAGIPVSIRPPGDEGSLPAVSFIIADLATNVANPERRLAVITASTRRAKTLLQKLPRDSLEKWSAAGDAAIHRADPRRPRRPDPASIQSDHLERARAPGAPVFPRRASRGAVPGFPRHPRAGVEHHLLQLCGHADVRVCGMPGYAAAHATTGCVYRRSAG